jgi:hypothetical protein
MKISEAIKYLSLLENQDDEIIIAWWSEEDFDDVPPGQWSDLCSSIEDNLDWSNVHSAIREAMEERIADERDEIVYRNDVARQMRFKCQ